MPQSLVEREHELGLIEEALGAARAGRGAVVLLRGPAGIGKTSLARAAEGSATSAGFAVLRADGFELERDHAFGAARRLLADAPAGGGSVPGLVTGSGDELAVLHALSGAVADAAAAGPVLLCVDDAQWLDAPSLRFLLFCAQRIRDDSVAIVLAVRSGEADEAADGLLARLGAEPIARVHEPPPLSLEGTRAVVARRLKPATARLAGACHTATGGNPFLLRLLIDELSARGVRGDEADAVELVRLLTPAEVVDWVGLRLERLGPGPAALAEALAVFGGRVALRHAATLAELPLSEATAAADALHEAGVVEGGDPLGFVHPLVHAATRRSVPPAARAAAHGRAARILAGGGASPDEVATQLLHSVRGGDAWAAEQLRGAAADALAVGAPQAAAAYLRRALEEPPPSALRPAVLTDLAEAEALAGDLSATDHLDRALELVDSGAERAGLLARLGWMLHGAGRLSEARLAFERALAEPELPDALVTDLRTAHFALGAIDGTVPLDTILAHVRKTQGNGAGGTVTRPALAQLAVARVLGCADATETRELARAAIGPPASGPQLIAQSIALSCLIWCDDFAPAEDAIAAALAVARARNSLVDAAYLLFGRSWANYWRGQVAAAAADAGTAVEAWSGGWGLHLGGAAAWQALALVECDRADEAAATLARARAAGPFPIATHARLVNHAAARVALARGDAVAARDALLAIETEPEPFTHSPAVLPWRSDLAVALARLGEEAEAKRLAADELELARRCGVARAVGVALRGAALADPGPRAMATLEEAVSVLSESPARLELLRALVDLGALARSLGHRAQARVVLRRAFDVGGDTTATALRRRAVEELAATGVRVRRTADRGVDSLTPSERRVAEMAAEGRGNAEIARELFVSRKAVEFHLRNVYRKLGIAGRAALPEALGREEPS